MKQETTTTTIYALFDTKTNSIFYVGTAPSESPLFLVQAQHIAKAKPHGLEKDEYIYNMNLCGNPPGIFELEADVPPNLSERTRRNWEIKLKNSGQKILE